MPSTKPVFSLPLRSGNTIATKSDLDGEINRVVNRLWPMAPDGPDGVLDEVNAARDATQASATEALGYRNETLAATPFMRDSFAALLAITGASGIPVGAKVNVQGGGTYQRAADAASDSHLTHTASPLKWYVLPRAYEYRAVDFGYTNSAANRIATIRAALAAMATIAGSKRLVISGNVDIGTRSKVADDSDIDRSFPVKNINDLTLVSDGAVIQMITGTQAAGFNPVIFDLEYAQNVHFSGFWQFKDGKSWSHYGSYGGNGGSVPANWSGQSGAFPIRIGDGCRNVTGDVILVDNTRYGVGHTTATPTAPPATGSAARSFGGRWGKILARRVEYPFMLAENGDHVTAEVFADECLRPYILYGVTGAKLNATQRQSIPGFAADFGRKYRDTGPCVVDHLYESTDGYPSTPVEIAVSPASGNGFIYSPRVNLVCNIQNPVSTAWVRTYAIRVMNTVLGVGTQNPFVAGGSAVVDAQITCDRGQFEFGLGISPTADTTTNRYKLPISYEERSVLGGNATYSEPLSKISTSLAPTIGRKANLRTTPYYEHRQSVYDDAGAVYPISGWHPWKDASLAAITTLATINWEWVRIGANINYQADLTITAASGSIPASGYWWQLPYLPTLAVGGNPPRQHIGTVTVYDTSTGDTYYGRLFYSGSAGLPRIQLSEKLTSGGTRTVINQLLTNAAPFALDAGDTINIAVSYIADGAV